MAVKVYIPTSLRRLTADQATVEVETGDVAALFRDLAARFPQLKERLFDPSGQVHPYINVYVNDEEIAALQGPSTLLHDGDEVALIPMMAGGRVGAWSEDQIRRYSRHIILPEVGGKGQRKLLASSVLLIGAGGLGSPAGLYLAAAGVGTLGIVDGDAVDLSNLQRQILHHGHDLGRPKTQSAVESLADINPDVKVVPYQVVLDSHNAMDILAPYDVIVNGCDNFPTRYLVNDACVLLGKPLVDGSIFRFEGQTTVFRPGHGCYRCLFPAPPPPGTVPSCAEAGVLGVLPGVIGVIQALEAVKLLLGIGEPLVGRLLLFDALTLEFREVKLRRDPNCPACGDNPTIKKLIDYQEFCGVPTLAH